jgi:hypothetical protein
MGRRGNSKKTTLGLKAVRPNTAANREELGEYEPYYRWPARNRVLREVDSGVWTDLESDCVEPDPMLVPEGLDRLIRGDGNLRFILHELGVRKESWESVSKLKRQAAKAGLRFILSIENAVYDLFGDENSASKAFKFLDRVEQMLLGMERDRKSYIRVRERTVAHRVVADVWEPLVLVLTAIKQHGQRSRRRPFFDATWAKEQAVKVNGVLECVSAIPLRKVCGEGNIRALATKAPTIIAAELLSEALDKTVSVDDLRRASQRLRDSRAPQPE